MWLLRIRRTPVSGPPVSATSDGLTIRLLNAVATSSRTTLEFALTHPDFPDDLEAMYGYSVFSPLQPGKDLILRGFAENAIYGRRESREPGTLLLSLELPPPAQTGAEVTVQFRKLRIHDARSGKILTYDGPWTFTFIPRTVTEARRIIPLDETIATDGVQIQVRELTLSESEAVVTYRILSGPQMLGSPQLMCAGKAYPGRDLSGATEGWLRTSFPVPPDETGTCRLVWGPFLVLAPEDIRLTLHWDALAREGEEVRFGEYAWFFEKPTVGPDATELVYAPAGEAAKRLVLATSPDTIRATDENGRAYPIESWHVEFDPLNWTVKRQALYLGGLVEPVKRLEIHTTQVGRVVEAVHLDVNLKGG